MTLGRDASTCVSPVVCKARTAGTRTRCAEPFRSDSPASGCDLGLAEAGCCGSATSLIGPLFRPYRSAPGPRSDTGEDRAAPVSDPVKRIPVLHRHAQRAWSCDGRSGCSVPKALTVRSSRNVARRHRRPDRPLGSTRSLRNTAAAPSNR